MKEPSFEISETIRPELQEKISQITSFVAEKKKEIVEGTCTEAKLQRDLETIFKLHLLPLGKCQSEAENRLLLSLMDNLETQSLNLSGDNNSAPYVTFGKMLMTEHVNADDFRLMIAEKKDVAFASGLLSGEDCIEKLGLDKMNNDEIINLSNEIMKECYDESSGFDFEAWKTHLGYMVTNQLFKFLKLEDMSLESLVQFGEKYNYGYLWRQIIQTQVSKWQSLPQGEKEKLALRIAKSYASQIGIESDDDSVVDEVINYGGPVGAVLSGYVLHKE